MAATDLHRDPRSELLDRIAHGTSSDWFNQLDEPTRARTGGRTLTEVWQSGDHATVEQLVDEWQAASRASAERLERDAEFLALVEARRADFAARDAETARHQAELAQQRARDAQAHLSA